VAEPPAARHARNRLVQTVDCSVEGGSPLARGGFAGRQPVNGDSSFIHQLSGTQSSTAVIVV
jgi:hypothetical protein